MKEILFVGAGSAIGGMLRYLLSRAILVVYHSPFPLATFLINIAGSFTIGYLFCISSRQGWSNPGQFLFLATGLCGGFTTFSAFSYENLLLLRNGQVFTAVIYILASILLGIAGCFAGYYFGK